ncbi:MAG: methyltransferase domain-containing protein [Dehalococcoidales bacterium]|nr:methyltransferase domain-containing protein [Dehalococcoidales bacterium]
MLAFWNLYATVYDSLPNHFQPYQKLVQQVVEEVDKYSSKGTVLDAGCGTGNFSVALAKRGYDVIGIDNADGMLNRARSKQNGISNLRLLKSDLGERLAFPDNYFSGIISVHTLYTMRDPEGTLKEYHRLLSPGGVFVLSELQQPIEIKPVIEEAINRNGWSEAINVFYHLFILGLFNVALGKKLRSGLYHYWNESRLKEILTRTGFSVISVKETYTNNRDLLITSTKR